MHLSVIELHSICLAVRAFPVDFDYSTESAHLVHHTYTFLQERPSPTAADHLSRGLQLFEVALDCRLQRCWGYPKKRNTALDTQTCIRSLSIAIGATWYLRTSNHAQAPPKFAMVLPCF
jgi:hypothetical protein